MNEKSDPLINEDPRSRKNSETDGTRTFSSCALSNTQTSRFITITSAYHFEYKSLNDKSVKTGYDVGVIRSTRPISHTCNLFYFVIKVLNKGIKGAIRIGLVSERSSMDSMLGWENFTIGYHGDDGKLYHGKGRQCRYGPIFTTDDVIGCGVDMKNRVIFFTKNGAALGIASTNLPDKTWFPTIGLCSSNEKVKVNFGQEKFLFNKASYRYTGKNDDFQYF